MFGGRLYVSADTSMSLSEGRIPHEVVLSCF
jgi:hypothetical protein